MNLAFVSLGCKVNRTESAELADLCRRAGHRIGQPDPDTDVIVVASCTVTSGADRDVRRAVRRAARQAPRARIVVAGCLPQRQAEPWPEPALAAWVGIDDRWRLPELLAELEPGRVRVEVSPAGAVLPPAACPEDPERARGFVVVQSGCNQACSYCIVPRVRGRERSRPPERVFDQIRRLAAGGRREIVLTGTHLGRYGRDLAGRWSLARLVEDMLAREPEIRIRLSSLEPGELAPELIEVMAAGGRVCPHLHIPLQSGSDRVLARMNRPAVSGQVRRRIEAALGRLDRPALGADLIVGFPGESAADFRASLELVEALPVTYLHVFPFSPRPGTAAAALGGRPAPSETEARSRELRALAAERQAAFRTGLAGLAEEACVLTRPPGRPTRALLARYLAAELEGPAPAPGSLVAVRVAEDLGRAVRAVVRPG